MTTTPFSGLMNDAASRLATIEAQVLQDIKLNLLQKVTGVWPQADDDLFRAHTTYSVECWKAGLSDLASRFWEQSLSAEVAAAEVALSKQNPPSRIHKGAPLYNSGFGYLLAGNLDKAVALISEAGLEESKRSSSSSHGLLLGNHELTERAIIVPLVKWIEASTWKNEISTITSVNFDLAEAKSLINWLSRRAENAIQLIVTHLRLKLLETYPRNDAVRHIRVQTLADMLLIVESSLRSWQAVTLQGQQLYGRLENMLSANSTSLAAFKAAELRFAARFPKDPTTNLAHPDKETSVAVNWVIGDTLTKLASATSVAERAGVGCHMVARLRNSLMHVIDGSIDLYAKDAEFDRVAGITFSTVRLSKAGDEGTISTLPII